MSIKDVIKKRRSVRTFDGKSLSGSDRDAISSYLSENTNPFDIPIVFKLLDAKEGGLSSPVIVGAETYIAAKVEKVPHHEIAFGYSFENICLYALSRGLGTVMLAASLNRSAFEKAMAVQENEVLPLASPIGYPAAKQSIRENLMRKGLHADDRLSFDKLFFANDFEHALSNNEYFAEALEYVRLAPSAGNAQPWRVVVEGDRVHFYEAKTMRENRLGDIQKVDVGIALCHFNMVLQEDGVTGDYVFDDPGLSKPVNTEYIVTYRRN